MRVLRGSKKTAYQLIGREYEERLVKSNERDATMYIGERLEGFLVGAATKR